MCWRAFVYQRPERQWIVAGKDMARLRIRSARCGTGLLSCLTFAGYPTGSRVARRAARLRFQPSLDIGGVVAYPPTKSQETRASAGHPPLRNCIRTKSQHARDLLGGEQRTCHERNFEFYWSRGHRTFAAWDRAPLGDLQCTIERRRKELAG